MLEAISIVFVEVHVRQQIPYSSFSGSRFLKDALSTLVASQDRHQICKRYPISMSVVHFLAEREPRMPQLRQKAPLLATLLCLERRGHKWPDQEFFEYAKAEAAPFPALVRWVQERIECWRAIQPDGDLEGVEHRQDPVHHHELDLHLREHEGSGLVTRTPVNTLKGS